jgi:hypothetical protein
MRNPFWTFVLSLMQMFDGEKISEGVIAGWLLLYLLRPAEVSRGKSWVQEFTRHYHRPHEVFSPGAKELLV